LGVKLDAYVYSYSFYCMVLSTARCIVKYFVWLNSPKGPIAQVWNDMPVIGEKFKPLFQKELTLEQETDWESGFVNLTDLMEIFKNEKSPTSHL
jgi:hypothetical protein